MSLSPYIPQPKRNGIHVQAIDMRTQKWGELTAIRPTTCGHWEFVCDEGHKNFILGLGVRHAFRRAQVNPKHNMTRCPTCLEKERDERNRAKQRDKEAAREARLLGRANAGRKPGLPPQVG